MNPVLILLASCIHLAPIAGVMLSREFGERHRLTAVATLLVVLLMFGNLILVKTLVAPAAGLPWTGDEVELLGSVLLTDILLEAIVIVLCYFLARKPGGE